MLTSESRLYTARESKYKNPEAYVIDVFEKRVKITVAGVSLKIERETLRE